MPSLNDTADVLLLQLLEYFTYNLIITHWILINKRCKQIINDNSPRTSNMLVILHKIWPYYGQSHPIPKRLTTTFYNDYKLSSYFKSVHTLKYTLDAKLNWNQILIPKQITSLELLVPRQCEESNITRVTFDTWDEVFDEKTGHGSGTCNKSGTLKSLKIVSEDHLNQWNQAGVCEFVLTAIGANPKLQSLTLINWSWCSDPRLLWWEVPKTLFKNIKHFGCSESKNTAQLFLSAENFPKLTSLTVYTKKNQPRHSTVIKIKSRKVKVEFKHE